jgi:CheY-specific phosphatase CheX
VNENLIGGLCAAVARIGEGLFGEAPAAGEPTSVWLDRFRSNMTGVVGLAGERAGLVAVYATRDGVRALAARLTGSDEPTLDEMRDTLCELANMIAGNLGRDADGFPPLATSIPSVIEGENFYLRFVGGIERTIVPFTICGAEVIIDFVLNAPDSGGSGCLPPGLGVPAGRAA